MGIGNLPTTITFQQNPTLVFDDPLLDYPSFTKRSFNMWFYINGPNGFNNFNKEDLSNIVSFDADWTTISDEVLFDPSINNLGVGPSNSIVNLGKILPPSLETIGKSSFRDLGLRGGLDLSGCPLLQKIDNSGFADNSFNDKLILNCPSLTEIGQFAFIPANVQNDISNNLTLLDLSSGFSSLDICNLPTLQTIGPGAFFANSRAKGDLDFSLMTDLSSIGELAFSYHNLNGTLNFGNLPKLKNIGNYAFAPNIKPIIVNISGGIQPNPIPDNSFTGFTGPLDISGLTGLKKLGELTFSGNSFTGQLIIKDMSNLEELGGQAFGDNSFTSVDITNNSNLSSIGVNCFVLNNLVNGVKIHNNPNLSDISFNAFTNSNISNLDLSSLPSLENIGFTAFLDNNISGPINFKACPKLKTIQTGAFARSIKNGSGLDFSDLSNLESIGDLAFLDNSLNGAVKFTNCNNLADICFSAFLQSGITTGGLDFSGLTSLKTIHESAFAINSVNGPVKFTNCISLNEIGEGAFSESGISGEVDFSGIGALTIRDEAFINNPNITQYVFNDNSGTIIGINVDPSMDGVDSSGSGSPPITWDNSGFDISSHGEYIFIKPS